MKTSFIAIKSLVFMTGFVLVWAWVAVSLRAFDERLGVTLPAWTYILGLLLVAAGAALGLTCIGFFVVRGRGTPAPFDAPREFVAAGPYTRVRNPMYVGGLTVLAGSGLYLQSISILLFSAAWALLAHVFVIAYEEPTLRARFGATYEEYCRRVPRWIPRITARADAAKSSISARTG